MRELERIDGQWYVTDTDSPDEEAQPFKMPTHKIVCPRCDGEGVHDHSAFANGITREQFDEDPEFEEQYLAGTYNVKCSVCEGLRVIDSIDVERLSPEIREALEKFEKEEDYYRRMHEAERRAGA